MFGNLGLILIYLGLGYGLRQRGWIHITHARWLVQYVIWIAYPAMVLAKLPTFLSGQGLQWSMLIPVSMPLLQFLIAVSIVIPASRWLGLTRAQTGALALTAGLGNTSFIGFPLVRAYFGESGLPVAMLTDQGSFFTVTIFGVALASIFSGNSIHPGRLLIKVVTFPPFLISVGSIILAVSDSARIVEGWLLHAIGSSLIPAAVVAIGIQLNLNREALTRNQTWLSFGLALKLLVLPAILVPTYMHGLGANDTARIIAFESTMAPMITAAIVADRYRLDQELSSLMVGAGIPLSFITTYFWQWAIKTGPLNCCWLGTCFCIEP